MSRRKQSNPKPLKWEECWNEAEDGENKSGKKIPRPTTTSPDSNTHAPKEEDPTPEESKQRARSLRLTSGSCDVEITRIKDNGDWNKRSLAKTRSSNQSHSSTDLQSEDCQPSQNVSTDYTTRRHERMSLSQSPEISNSGSGERNGSPGPFSHQILQAGLSYLHLLPSAIRNDASRYFMPQMLPPELAAPASSVSGSPQQLQQIKAEKVIGDSPRSGPVFLCEPCGIKFSSARTLEAHQTYYCSFRKDNGKDGDKNPETSESVKSEPEVVGIKRERGSSGEEHELLIDESQDRDGNPTPNISSGAKNMKTGKLYTCIYCSYSADKKVSLNRHMRMHSGVSSLLNSNQPTATSNDEPNNASPSLSNNSIGKPSSGGTPAGDGVGAALDRYCQDCDIQFNSIKTFRVHKQYYCSTRHVLKSQLLPTSSPANVAQLNKIDISNCSGSSTPGPRKSSGSPEGSPTPGPPTPIPTNQPFLVLPTSPVIIVPYCFIQGASILPGNILPNQNAIVVLPNGSVQGLPATPFMMPSPGASAHHSLGAAAAAAAMQQLLHHNNPYSGGGGNNSNMNSMAMVTATSPSPSGGSHSHNHSNLASGVFNDPKDVIRRIGGKGGRTTTHSDTDSQRSSSRCSREKDPEGDGCGCPELETESLHAPAIDLTLRTPAGDDEKENRGLMSHPERERERRIRSATPGEQQVNEFGHEREHELPSPNSERLSVGSGKSHERTPRPSSASLSSSCSSPPSHMFSEPGLGPNVNVKLPNGVKNGNGAYGNTNNIHMIGKSGVRSHPQLSGSNSRGKIPNEVDYNFNMAEKMRPIATTLPGGAILTSANNQSLAELLMSNPPELNESLAKLNTQLVMNSAAAAGFPLPPPGSFPPDLAIRLMDPNYLAALQHSFQQQQQQHHQQHRQQHKPAPPPAIQQPPPPAKRGVSKCIECDIVFYKYENYLVHKERYCAARESVSKESQGVECGTVKESISSNSSPVSEDGGEGDGGLYLSPPSQNQHLRRSTSSTGAGSRSQAQAPPQPQHGRSLLRKSSETSMGNPTTPSKVNSISHTGCGSPPSPTTTPDSKIPSNQYPCLKCGVKYSTFDNLTTHQTYYCNKRGTSGSVELSPSPKTNGGDSQLGEQGFLRCRKCRLAIPEEQMNLHSTVCQTSGGGAVGVAVTPVGPTPGTGHLAGWKCPCCETHSPTMAAAQKHLESHTGIRAFKCLLCGYRGNTLRGMRTHIRMHFDKRVSDLQEGDYIACITSKDLETATTTTNTTTGQGNGPNVLSSAAATAAVHAVSTGNAGAAATGIMTEPLTRSIKVERDSPATIQMMKSSPPATSAATDLNPDLTSVRQVENNNRLHFCHLCNYSSSYKGNVVRHMKLVHKISEDGENEAGGGMEERNGDPEDSCGSLGSRSRSPEPVVHAQAPKIPDSLNPRVRIEKRCSSRLSAEGGLTITTAVTMADEDDLNEGGGMAANKKEKPCPVKYCKPCDMYFNVLSTFIAHKKLYCPSHNPRVGVTESEALEQRERAETPVQ